MKKGILKVWAFSSAASHKTYETLQYTDGSTSCNCPGWTRIVHPDGSRSCKHTRWVDLGRADQEALDSKEYYPIKSALNLRDAAILALHALEYAEANGQSVQVYDQNGKKWNALDELRSSLRAQYN